MPDLPNLTSLLSKDQRQALHTLVGMMVPASREYGVPGADDDKIFETILATAQVDVPVVVEGLKALEAMSNIRQRKGFNALDHKIRQQLVDEYRQSPAPYVNVIVNITMQCYYRDERVMKSLGMEVRAPFPKGFEVEQGDWSLLEPVKRRPKMYRKV